MGRILFFEDEDAFAKRETSRLSRKLGPRVRIELAKTILAKSALTLKAQKSSGTIEPTFVHRLVETFRKSGDIDLIVTDVNLSEMPSYAGLSAEVIGEVGRRLFIPVCVYSRNVPNDFKRIQDSQDSTTKLESQPDSEAMSGEIAALYNGFVGLKRLYKTRVSKKSSLTLAQSLAEMLEKPHYADRFSLYGLGNQAFLELTPLMDKNVKSGSRPMTIPYLLGRWLLASILKFPGVLANRVAVASHLNISLEHFDDAKIRRVFQSAEYVGPFCELKEFWWRYELDEIVAEGKASSGLELVRKRINPRIKPCKCTVDSTLDAGYYCIVNQVPVSRDKSTGEISWIPKGADLARVSNPVYNKLKPWIGMF